MKTVLYIFSIVITCSCKSKSSDKKASDESKAPKTSANNGFEERTAKMIAYNDSLNQTLEWKQVEDDLYINKNGELGIQAFRLLDPPDEGYVYYQKCLRDDKKTPINTIIDVSTYKRLSSGGFGAYYKDKNHIYHTFGTSDGTNFSVVEEADYKTFEIINDCYGRDKNHVYDMRFGVMEDIDPKEFIILPRGNFCLAKYKGTYYRGNDPLNEEELKDPEIKKAIKQLDKYISKTKKLSN